MSEAAGPAVAGPGWAIAIALGMAMPALAQEAQRAEDAAGDDQSIIVTGERQAPSRREVVEQAVTLSRIDPRRLYERAMARFAMPLCPGVMGMKTGAAEALVGRIRDNAAQIDVPLAGGRCSPNLIVAFVEDGRAVLDDMMRQRPERFARLAPAERDELQRGIGPVRVWSRVEPRYASGAPLPRWRGEIEWPSVRGRIDKFFLPTRTDIDSALILFDRDAVRDLTLTQLADYATMRGLAHMRPATGDERLATILSLFAPEGRQVAALTAFDIGYLRSLYWERPDEGAISKLLRVRKLAQRAREGGTETERP